MARKSLILRGISDIKALASKIDILWDKLTATDIPITDSGNYLTATNINAALQEIMAKAYLQQGFFDRGDPTSADYTQATLTLNGNWVDLDLSAIVSAGAKAIYINVNAVDDTDGYLQFRKNGNTNTLASTYIPVAAGITIGTSIIVPCDTGRVIEYAGSNKTWSTVNITVLGWFK